MLKVIGVLVIAVIGWAILKLALFRLFPVWGLKEAEARYKRDPDDINERLLWEARDRVEKYNKKKGL